MKKVLILSFAAILVLSLTGCGIKKKIENKIGEAIGEKVVEGITNSNVDLDGDKITIKGEDGTEVTMGGTEWPENDLLKDVPKFDKGTINGVTESDALVMILIDNVEQKDFESYCEEIKKRFTENSMSFDIDDVISYGADNGKGVYAQVAYNTSDSTLSINISKMQE